MIVALLRANSGAVLRSAPATAIADGFDVVLRARALNFFFVVSAPTFALRCWRCACITAAHERAHGHRPAEFS
jgi:hypothetical protein